MLATLKELQLATLMFFHLFTLCCAHVSALVTVLSDSPCERTGKWETLSDFERGQIFGVHLDGASVKKHATLLGVLRTTVCEVMSAYTNDGKISAKRNSM
jgi:hypothetical protein